MPELELLPEKTQKIEIGPKKTLWPVLSFLIAVLGIYGALFFYNQILENKIEGLDKALIDFNGQRNKDEEARINEVNAKLAQAQGLLDEHLFWSKGFKQIQELTLPSVQFKYIAASLPELKFEFRALAPNLTAIAKQAANLLADDSVKDVSINQIKVLTTGQTEFGIKLIFNENKFLKQ
jgi:hypothetical protein